METLVHDVTVKAPQSSYDHTAVNATAARVCAKQPAHVGFGYVLHVSAAALRKAETLRLNEFRGKGVVFEKKQPVFLRTELPYVRVTFNRGDKETAVMVYATLSEKCGKVFKNWL